MYSKFLKTIWSYDDTSRFKIKMKLDFTPVELHNANMISYSINVSYLYTNFYIRFKDNKLFF